MINNSNQTPWIDILSAPSSGQALKLAAAIHPCDLANALFPCHYSELSHSACENALAVRRAFGVSIPGLSSTGWDLWNDDSTTSFTPTTTSSLHCSQQNECTANTAKQKATQQDELQKEPTTRENPSSSLPSTTDKLKQQQLQQERQEQILDENPSTEDTKHAQILHTWATTRSHTSVPQSSIFHLSRARSLSKLLKTIILPSSSSSSVTAAVLRAFTSYNTSMTSDNNNINTNNGEMALSPTSAHALYTLVVFPYVSNLRAPASRDMMQAILTLSEAHWRPVVPVLFRPFAETNGLELLNAPVSELFARIAGCLPSEAAARALEMLCNLNASAWKDHCVPLVHALFTQARAGSGSNGRSGSGIESDKGGDAIENDGGEVSQHDSDNDNVVDVLVPALARNVGSLEKSVRLGKLLFTLAKDVPSVRNARHRQTMETVCSRSKVFLAKRALTLLKQPVQRDTNP